MTEQNRMIRALSYDMKIAPEVRTLAEAVSDLRTSVSRSQDSDRELLQRLAQIEGRLMRLEQELHVNRISSLPR